MTNFQYILHKIQAYIKEKGLRPGDRLPSERELVEQLQVGRSSIREALKALELIGIISTRRGEGTFLEDASSHRFIELLGQFIIQDPGTTERELRELNRMLEEQAVCLAERNIDSDDLDKLNTLIALAEGKLAEGKSPSAEEEEFFRILAMKSGNSIFQRMYFILRDFSSLTQFSDRQEDAEPIVTRLKEYYAKLQNDR
jgi:GntR family transcriptional repressor for pyruvate dehydrogenase complex